MTSFWKNLHRLTQDQMFTRGYISLRTVAEIAAKRQAQEAHDGAQAVNGKSCSKATWPRLAAFH
jgi:hypothetical protein